MKPTIKEDGFIVWLLYQFDNYTLIGIAIQTILVIITSYFTAIACINSKPCSKISDQYRESHMGDNSYEDFENSIAR